MGKKKVKRNLLQEMWRCRRAYLFLLPLFAGLCVFSYYPPVLGIFRSFFEWDGVRKGVFTGFDNYRKLFEDQVFLQSIPTMIKIMLPKLIIGIVVPLIMAEMIFNVKRKKLQSMYRILVLLPIVAPGVVGTLIWKNIFDPNGGLLTAVLKLFHILEEGQIVDWLGSVETVIPSIIFMGFPWIGGTSVLIYTSGLMNISQDVLEASKLDGCSTIKRIFLIDLPNIMGQVRYFLIFGIIGGLQDYSVQIVLTQGRPGYTTYVPGYYMYVQAFTAGNMGYACAVGTAIFLVIAVITAATFKITHSEGFQ